MTTSISRLRVRCLPRILLAAMAACACSISTNPLSADDTPGDAADAVLATIQGKWIVTAFEMNGQPRKGEVGTEITVDQYKMFGLKGMFLGTFKLDTSKNPMQIDILAPKKGGENQLLGIVKIEGKIITLAYGAQRPGSFDDHPMVLTKWTRKGAK